MTDLYLRAESADALAGALPFIRGDSGKWITEGDGFDFNGIGSVVTTPAEYNEAGAETSPAVIDHRFHANLRCSEEVADAVSEDIQVFPENPSRVWA